MNVNNLSSILIVKVSALGDLIHTFPTIAFLRDRFPKAQIDWVVEQPFAEMIKAHPEVHQVYPIQTKKWRQNFFRKDNRKEILTFRKKIREQKYDVVFDLQGNLKSGLITSQVKAKAKVGFGSLTVPEWPNLFFTSYHYNPPLGKNIRDDYLFLIQSFLGDSSPFEHPSVHLQVALEMQNQIHEMLQLPALQMKKKVLVCPGAFWRNKQLNEESLLYLLLKMQNYLSCSFLFAWGSEPEFGLVNRLHQHFADTSYLIPKLPLPVLQNLMSCMDLIVAMDSMPLHLAGTTATPTFSVFGPSSALKYRPKGMQNFSMQGNCPYGRSFEKRCPILRSCETGQCIRGIMGKELFANFHSWWQERES